MNKFLLFIGFISCYIVQASNNFDIDNNDLDEMQFGSFHTSLGSFFDSDDESEPSDDMEQNIVVPKTKKLPVTPEEIRIHKEQQAKALAEERKRKEIGTYDAVSRCVHQFFTYGAKSYKGIGYSDFFKKYQNEVDAFLASLAEDHSVMLPAYIVEDIHDELSIKQRQNINLPSEIVENGQWQQVMKYYKIVGIMPSTFRTKDQKGKWQTHKDNIFDMAKAKLKVLQQVHNFIDMHETQVRAQCIGSGLQEQSPGQVVIPGCCDIQLHKSCFESCKSNGITCCINLFCQKNKSANHLPCPWTDNFYNAVLASKVAKKNEIAQRDCPMCMEPLVQATALQQSPLKAVKSTRNIKNTNLALCRSLKSARSRANKTGKNS